MIRRRLNAGKFRRAGNPDAGRHLAGDTHMLDIHDGIVDPDSRIAAQKMVPALRLQWQVESKRFQQ